ncbi:MAG: ribosome maturation factor RimM [Acidimicrobiales bacterium]
MGCPAEDGPLLQVGRIVKPHGLRGEVIVSLSTNRDERAAMGSRLRSQDGRELVVVGSSAHQGRFIVSFQDVTSIEDADALRGTILFASPIDDPDALWVHELVGALAVDLAGRELGVVEGVQANPASDLLVLADGNLIPLRFVIALQPRVRVTVDVPDGLLDLV